MNYDVELSDEAVEDLDRLPAILQSVVLNHLEYLARNPTLVSKPATFPYWQVQSYRFDHLHDGEKHFFTVLFKYSADERSLYILAIPHQSL